MPVGGEPPPGNAISNGYLVPDRTGFGAGGFVTKSSGEEYYYVVEMTPTSDAAGDTQSGPRMSPILDDVVVLYAPWSAARVITESEVTND